MFGCEDHDKWVLTPALLRRLPHLVAIITREGQAGQTSCADGNPEAVVPAALFVHATGPASAIEGEN